MNTYYADVNASGKLVYYRASMARYIKVSSAQVELEVAQEKAQVLVYIPNKPFHAYTDLQLVRVRAAQSESAVTVKMIDEEIAKRAAKGK
jgi:hypothetical protein